MVDEYGNFVHPATERQSCLLALGGIVLFIVFAWLFLTEGGKKRPNKNGEEHYDERQRLARFSAYRAAFWVLAVYTVVNSFLTEVGISWTNPFLQEVFGLTVAEQLFITICVWKGAWVSKREWCLAGSAEIPLLLWTLNWVEDVVLYRERIFENGTLTQGGFSLTMLVTCIFPIGAYVLKTVRERRERDGE